MDMPTIINKLDTLTAIRRQELIERWKSHTLTAEDKEELKKGVAMAIVKLQDQKLAQEITKAMWSEA